MGNKDLRKLVAIIGSKFSIR